MINDLHPHKPKFTLRPAMAALITVIIMVTQQAAGMPDRSDPIRVRIENAVAAVKPALVQIHVVRTLYAKGREIKRESTGSGTIITPEGHVITNHHVAAHAARVFCILSNKEKIEADLVGTDPLSDIAVLKLRTAANRQFPFARFGDSSAVRVGDRVLAMGSPISLSQSVTLGIVSNIGITLPKLLKKGRYRIMLDGEDVGTFVLWIGHDAAIFPGNSGGPLVDLSGNVVGINEIGIGLGGAIPSNIARSISREIIDTGRVVRGWTGWEVQPRLSRSVYSAGILLSGVAADSPAERSGFQPGDIIVRVGETKIDVRSPEELPLFNQTEADLPVGEKTEVGFVRNGKPRTAMIVPEEREPAKRKASSLRSWGITVRNVSGMAARELKRSNRKGVLITSVSPGGPGGDAKPALRKGDIILRLDDKPVETVADLVHLSEDMTADKIDPVPALVTFDRGTDRFITVVKIGIRDLQDQGLEATKAWLPVATQVITRDIGRILGEPEMTGVRVTQVYKGTTAEKAGLSPGDLILYVNEEPVVAAYQEDFDVFQSMIRQHKIDAIVDLDILRKGDRLTIPVRLMRSPRLAREMAKYRDENFEFTVRDLTFYDRANNQWAEDQNGVGVEEVTPGSWAALAELAVGDTILDIDGKAVDNVDTFSSFMADINQDRPETIVFHVQRGVHHIYLELEPKWD